MDGSTLGVKKKFKEYQVQTQNFINELETILKDFESKGDVKEFSEKVKESIKKFQQSEK